MAVKIIWSPEALTDIDRIAEFIRRDSEFYAAKVVQRIVAAVERAAIFPKLARKVPEFDDDAIREVFVHSYRVIYRVGKDRIDIAAVIHGSRLLQNAIGDRSI